MERETTNNLSGKHHSQEFHDWSQKVHYKDLTDPQKFKATYSDDFVQSIDVKLLISKEYVN